MRPGPTSLKTARTVFERRNRSPGRPTTPWPCSRAGSATSSTRPARAAAVEVGIAVSESPAVREKVRGEVKALPRGLRVPFGPGRGDCPPTSPAISGWSRRSCRPSQDRRGRTA
ncbi:MAG: hypothetical protein M0C28_00845 [Candidatus Moduliflexus flocculans]|nr:hypothetical protein [Candidatus Moduliflexus flocculans]